MRAVKSKLGHLHLIGREQYQIFNKIDFNKFMDINSLSERECFIAEELYRQDLIKKVNKGGKVGYKIYPQKQLV
jgi:hypothetical protein